MLNEVQRHEPKAHGLMDNLFVLCVERTYLSASFLCSLKHTAQTKNFNRVCHELFSKATYDKTHYVKTRDGYPAFQPLKPDNQGVASPQESIYACPCGAWHLFYH
ncbi:MAG: hypothetical protein AB1650_03460 [Candidatus Omnitrophota bacterium]